MPHWKSYINGTFTRQHRATWHTTQTWIRLSHTSEGIFRENEILFELMFAMMYLAQSWYSFIGALSDISSGSNTPGRNVHSGSSMLLLRRNGLACEPLLMVMDAILTRQFSNPNAFSVLKIGKGQTNGWHLIMTGRG